MARTILERLLGYEAYDEGRDPLDTGFGNIEPKRQGVAEFGKGLLDMGGQAARGTAAGAIALPHDISTIGTALWQLQDDLPDRDKMNWWEAFGTRMANAEAAQPDWLPSYQDADQALPEFTPMSETFADYSEGNRPIETFSSMAFAPYPYVKAYQGMKAIPNPLREGGALNPKRVEGVVESPRIRLLEQMDEQQQLPPTQPRLLAPEPEAPKPPAQLQAPLSRTEVMYDNGRPVAGEGLFKHFTEDALRPLDVRSKGREVVVNMPIEQFLKLSDTFENATPEYLKMRDLSGVEKFDDIPYLTFDAPKDGIAQVSGHEGRHRAVKLLERGETTMPVRLRVDKGNMDKIRWDSQTDPDDYYYSDVYPDKMIGQSNSESYKTGEIFSFPVQRGQSGILPDVVQSQTFRAPPEPEIPEGALSASTFVQPEAIRLFAESGGSPAPSIGIARADSAPDVLGQFGDVQLLVNPDRIRQGNYRIYGDDAYLGRAPELSDSYEPMDVALAMANDPEYARYSQEIPQFIQDYIALDVQRLGVNTELVRQDALYRAVKVIQQSADYDRPLPDVAQAVINYEPGDYFTEAGLRSVDAKSRFVEAETGLPYDAEAALSQMMGRDAQVRGAEFGDDLTLTPKQNLFAREFKDLDEAAAERHLLRNRSERKFPKNDMLAAEFDDLMLEISRKFFDELFDTGPAHQGARDILEGRNIDQLMQKYNMKPEDIKTIKDKITNLQDRYRFDRKNYFEAKGDEVIKLEDFDAVVIDEMYTDAIKILEDAGVKKILTYGTPKERAEIFKKYPELLFSLMLVGFTGPALMQEQEQGDGS